MSIFKFDENKYMDKINYYKDLVCRTNETARFYAGNVESTKFKKYSKLSVTYLKEYNKYLEKRRKYITKWKKKGVAVD